MLYEGPLDYEKNGFWVATLYLYIASVIFEFGTLITIAFLYQRLPARFSNYAIISTACMLFGFGGSLLYYVTENSSFECTVDRVVTYSVRYIGFFVFDILQILKITAIVSSADKTKKFYSIYFLAFVRLLSYVYNAVYVSGAVVYNVDNGLGPCKTVFSRSMVYQEHLVSVIFELGLLIHLAMYIFQTAKNEAVIEMMKSLIDFEVYTFIVYMVSEIIYVSIFALVSSDHVSMYNIFYLNLPVALFLANAVNIIMKRKKFSIQSENKSRNGTSSKSRVSEFKTYSSTEQFNVARNSTWGFSFTFGAAHGKLVQFREPKLDRNVVFVIVVGFLLRGLEEQSTNTINWLQLETKSMSAFPIERAIPFEGGSVVSGIVLTLTSLALYEYGISVDIFNDRSRQKLVMLISFIGGVAGLVFYGSNQTKLSWIVTNISVFILFLTGQYGMVIINHNSIIRLAVALNFELGRIQRICGFLYVLPWVSLIPIYFAIHETYSLQVPLTTSTWNTVVSKELFLILIFVTEILATVTDIMLLNKVQDSANQVRNVGHDHKTDLHVSYAVIWFFMIADFTVKILITQGYPFLFDAIITICVVVLRARTNLYYGVLLRRVLEGSSYDISNTHTNGARTNNAKETSASIF
ncbi:hypothetical protein HDV06_003005 [Boothiomyces sp. JEL0866]|nr:hypothetical protein HDV06_003005 [Boothiomyces sp. JEL0866]